MSLRESLNRARIANGPAFRLHPLPERAKTTLRQLEIAERYSVEGKLQLPPDLNEISSRLHQALGRPGSTISRRDLRYAPLCIWDIEDPISEDRRSLQDLLDHLHRAGKRSIIRTLAAVYFRMYRKDRLGIDLVGLALSSMVNSELAILHELQEKFEIFNPERGPVNVARHCAVASIEPRDLLQGFGLSTQAVAGGIGLAVYREGMNNFRTQLNISPSIEIVRNAERWTGEIDDTPYENANRTLAETLLLPFRDQAPDDEIKNRILEILLERIGDPRTKSQNWVQMRECGEIARNWLTRLALLQFFEVVDDVALRAHWEYRRAFWMAFYDRGYIQEAWVAFGPDGRRRAYQAFGKSATFGRLATGWKQVESGHAVLLMRIGDFTVVDWSHNGRCIIWPNDHEKCPSLYRGSYDSGLLAPRVQPQGGFEQTHVSSQTYAWQKNVSQFLRRHAGVSLQLQDFRVR